MGGAAVTARGRFRRGVGSIRIRFRDRKTIPENFPFKFTPPQQGTSLAPQATLFTFGSVPSAAPSSRPGDQLVEGGGPDAPFVGLPPLPPAPKRSLTQQLRPEGGRPPRLLEALDAATLRTLKWA